MAVILANHVLLAAALVTGRLEILDHVLIGIFLGVDSSLGALDGETEGIGDDDGVGVGVSLHQTHDFDGTAGTSMHDHFDESDGTNADVFKVVRILSPGFRFVGRLLAVGRIGIEGIANWVNQLYAVVELCEEFRSVS